MFPCALRQGNLGRDAPAKSGIEEAREHRGHLLTPEFETFQVRCLKKMI
jgi:hypothetical protein